MAVFPVVKADFPDDPRGQFGRHFNLGDAGTDAGILDPIVAIVAAEEQLIGRNLAAIRPFDGRAVKADVGNVMQAAAVGTAAHLDADFADPLIPQQVVFPRVQFRPHGLGQAHRGGNAQFAAVGAGAGDYIGDGVGAGFVEADLPQGGPNIMQPGVRHPAQSQVLLLRGLGPAAGVAAHNIGQTPELGRGQVAADWLDIDHIIAGLFLRGYIRFPPVAIIAAAVMPVDRRRRDCRRGFRVDFLLPHQRLGVNGADLRQLLLDQLAELLQANAVNQYLDPGHHPILAEGYGLVKDGPDRQGQAQVVFFGQKVVQGFGQAGHNGSAAAHINLEPPLPVPDLGDISQILNGGGHRVPGVNAGKGGLELAGKGLGDGMADAETHIGGQIGRGVKNFLGVHAGGGRADHIADGVAAGFPAGQSRRPQQTQDFGTLRQGDVMKLDILAGGDVALMQGGVGFGHFPQSFQGRRRKDAAGDFDPNHLDFGLALPVHPLPQAKGSELGIILFPRLEPGRFPLKPLHLLLHKGDDAGRGRGQFHTPAVDFLLDRRLGRFGYAGQRGLLEFCRRFFSDGSGQFRRRSNPRDCRAGCNAKIKPAGRGKAGGRRDVGRYALDAET